MVPYKDFNNLTPIKRNHNACLSADRVVIEHAIGLLKERWRRLHFIKTYNISKTIEIASAACVLHNFCLLNDDNYILEECGRQYNHEQNIFRDIDNRAAKAKRDRIANNLFQM